MNTDKTIPADTESLALIPKTDGVYTHKFSDPFQWMDKTYETLEFHFSKLRGRDALAIYKQLRDAGIFVSSGRTSQEYQLLMAVKACGLGADAFDNMPLRDFEVILGKARNFIPITALI